MPKSRGKPPLQVVPKLVVTSDTPSYYVNYIQVSNTQYDFSLSVARIGSPLSEEQFERIKKGEPLLMDAILQIIMPPAVAEGLIKALTEQQQKYQEALAKQQEGGQIEGIEGKRKQSNRLQ
jgi:hypothetical protein